MESAQGKRSLPQQEPGHLRLGNAVKCASSSAGEGRIWGSGITQDVHSLSDVAAGGGLECTSSKGKSEPWVDIGGFRKGEQSLCGRRNTQRKI